MKTASNVADAALVCHLFHRSVEHENPPCAHAQARVRGGKSRKQVLKMRQQKLLEVSVNLSWCLCGAWLVPCALMPCFAMLTHLRLVHRVLLATLQEKMREKMALRIQCRYRAHRGQLGYMLLRMVTVCRLAEY